MLVPVILCGGRGTRLWPLSRELYPKHIIPLVSEDSLLKMTAERLSHLMVEPPLVISNSAHRFMVAEELRRGGVTGATILLEPVGRNTAPAVCTAALRAREGGEDPLLLVLPSDHYIGDADALARAVQQGTSHAEAGRFVLFGIPPTRPETGYGYILEGEETDDGLHEVCAFVEKPQLESAKTMCASGDHYWNSGMFLFKASALVKAMERYAPDILASCRKALAEAHEDLDFVRLGEEPFAACRSESIDYAVMEKVEGALVVPLLAEWSDLGSYDALYAVGQRDESGNARVGDVVTLDVSDSYLRSEHGLLTVVGVENLAVVVTKDAVLVASRERSEDVKALVSKLAAEAREEVILHSKVYRPWGAYETVDMAERFQVKRITVNPGAELSLQMHHHRAEHWIVVKGSAEVTCDGTVSLLTENESTYIPLGSLHRLKNPGVLPLELIEVQTGSYLGEDDIVRVEDHYGREGQNSMT